MGLGAALSSSSWGPGAAVQRMVKLGTLPFHFDKSKAARFGLLPRQAADEASIRWFELPGQMIFHTANAWQVHAGRFGIACCLWVPTAAEHHTRDLLPRGAGGTKHRQACCLLLR